MVGTGDSVLIGEVSFIQSVLYREVPMTVFLSGNGIVFLIAHS